MINTREINAVASKYKLNDTQVEKDYVLSWILFAISAHELFSKILAFKGGTVLKKVYFEDYRFSEDLDFTLLDDSVANDILIKEFEEVYAFVKEKANITLQFKGTDVHESGSPVFYINYVGPLQGAIGSRDVKVDITRGEILGFEIETREVIITYSDLPEISFSFLCYSLPEVLIEKMVALMGRTEPRDLYDFWYLVEKEGLSPKDYKREFEHKARNKKLNPAEFEKKVLSKEKNFKQGWERKLENQMDGLPKFENILRESKRHFRF